VLDNYDSFTWNLVQPLAAWGAECLVNRSDRVTCAEVAELAPDRIIISPGPFGPDRTGACADVVRELGPRVPLLGVCLGMQVIAAVAGAEIRESGAPVHGKRRQVRHGGDGVLRGLPDPLTVGLYHSLIVVPDSVPTSLEVTARADDGVIMACRLRAQPVEGVLFHPESFLTDQGDRILRNFMDQPGGGGVE
jgi:anthranilate synthase/aminodeoxychorismate synthase-like glutamine amidotransferase